MADRFTDQFVAFMRMAPPQRRLAWRRGRGLQWLGLALAWFWLGLMLYLLRPVAFSPVFEPYRFLPPNLGTTAFDVLIVILLPLVTVTFTALALPSLSCWLSSAIVRKAALSGSTTLTVGAIDQPKPLAGDEIPQDAQPFMALKPPTVDKTTRAMVTLDAVLTLAFLLAAFVLWPSASGTGSSKDNLDLLLFSLPSFSMGSSSCLMAPQIIANGWWIFLPGRRNGYWRSMGGVSAGARHTGAHANRHSPGRISPPSASSGIYLYQAFVGLQLTYMLLGNDELSWVVPARANDAQRTASESLARLVVTQTGDRFWM